MNRELKKDLVNLFLIGGIFYFFYSVKSILLPFVLGIVIAYLSNGLTTKMEKKIGSRRFASIIMVSIITIVIFLFFAIIIPIIINQSIGLIGELMAYLNKNNDIIYIKLKDFSEKLGFNDSIELKTYVANYSKSITSHGMALVNNLLSGSVAFISLMGLIFITPITAYYFLSGWNENIKLINQYLPKNNAEKIRSVFSQINEVLMACLKSQMIVCILLGLFYGFGLFFAGLKYGFLIGLLTGIASFIPYIGMLLGFAIALFVNFYQFGLDPSHLVVLGIIFGIGQILESNFLTPKLVGDRIKLNPLWVIFALFSGGVLFGLLGMLVALPIAAVVGVLIRFFIKEKFKDKKLECNENNR